MISSSSRAGASPAAASAPTTAATSSRPRNWAADRFTATRTPPGQPAASAQARRSTHPPSGTISPVSSASGTNSPGGTRPRAGWRQRSSASSALDRARPQVDQRLVVQLQLARGERLPEVELEQPARLEPGVHAGLEAAEGAAAVRLGAVERHVGPLEQLVRVPPSPGASAMPTLAPTTTWWPSTS